LTLLLLPTPFSLEALVERGSAYLNCECFT
jgi:hypothetical protein